MLIIRIECTQLLSAVILNIVNSQIPNIPTIYKFQVYLSADRVFTKFIVYHYQKLCIIPNDSSTTGKLNSETQTHDLDYAVNLALSYSPKRGVNNMEHASTIHQL